MGAQTNCLREQRKRQPTLLAPGAKRSRNFGGISKAAAPVAIAMPRPPGQPKKPGDKRDAVVIPHSSGGQVSPDATMSSTSSAPLGRGGEDNQSSDPATAVDVAMPDMPSTTTSDSPDSASLEHFDDIVAYAVGQGESDVIQHLKRILPELTQFVVQIKKPHIRGIGDLYHPTIKAYFITAKSFLAYLDTITITPKIKEGLKSHQKIFLGHLSEVDACPAFILNRFNATWDRWAEVDFGRQQDDVDNDEVVQKTDVDSDSDSDSESPPSPAARNPSSSDSKSKEFEIPYPSRTHPVYGDNGIMDGLLCGRPRGGRVRYAFNPKKIHLKKNASVFGHNGFTPGDWFPLQLAACFRGAHGSSQGGISGSVTHGAYSIIVGSAVYEDTDRDQGDLIFYSGSQAQGDKGGDNGTQDSRATQCLLRSITTGKPIRVLRKKKPKAGGHGPVQGLRYDGLYQVEGFRDLGIDTGKYRSLVFTIQRLPGQLSLAEAKQRVPASEQTRMMSLMKKGYTPA